MINTFKDNDNKSSIDNLLQNKDDYKLLSKIQKKYNIEPQKELVFNYC